MSSSGLLGNCNTMAAKKNEKSSSEQDTSRDDATVQRGRAVVRQENIDLAFEGADCRVQGSLRPQQPSGARAQRARVVPGRESNSVHSLTQ